MIFYHILIGNSNAHTKKKHRNFTSCFFFLSSRSIHKRWWSTIQHYILIKKNVNRVNKQLSCLYINSLFSVVSYNLLSKFVLIVTLCKLSYTITHTNEKNQSTIAFHSTNHLQNAPTRYLVLRSYYERMLTEWMNESN